MTKIRRGEEEGGLSKNYVFSSFRMDFFSWCQVSSSEMYCEPRFKFNGEQFRVVSGTSLDPQKRIWLRSEFQLKLGSSLHV